MSERFYPAVYKRLAHTLGEQGWWPLLKKKDGRYRIRYDPAYKYRPKTAAEKREIIWGSILAQNTSWTNAVTALTALKRQSLDSLRAVIGVSHDRLAEVIRSSGYYNQKTTALKAAAVFFRDHGLRTAPSRHDLLTVHGVGAETADSILLYAFDTPVFVVDAYTVRILGRLTGENRSSYDFWQNSVTGDRRLSVSWCNDFHAMLVALGNGYCRRHTPRCGDCPLVTMCQEARKRSAGPLPDRKSV